LQLEAATAELDALRRAAAAAAAEAAGCSQWAQQQAHAVAGGSGCCAEAVAEMVKRRDEGLIRWFEGRIALLLQSAGRVSSSDADDAGTETPMMALTRQVRVCVRHASQAQKLTDLAGCDQAMLACTRDAESSRNNIVYYHIEQFTQSLVVH
jgi:hypothetical protein